MKKLLDFWDEKSRFIFFFTALIMFITHGFCFLNLMYSHDGLGFFSLSAERKIELGRWMIPFFLYQRNTATPWMIGVLSTIYVSLAAVLVTKIFDFNKAQGICVAMLFATSISLTALFCSYIHDGDADCMALLLACFAVYAFKYFPKYLNFVLPVASLVLCLAIYQGYMCVTLGLFLVLLIIKSKDIKNWKEVLRTFIMGIKEAFIVILSTVIYFLIMNVTAKHYDVEISNKYNGPGNLGSLSINVIFDAIPKAYQYFKDTFFEVTGYNTEMIVKLYWIMLLCIIVSIIVYIFVNRPFIGSLIITIPCVLLLPLFLNAIYLASFGTMHQLMIFAFCIILFIPLIFANMTEDFVKSKGLKNNSPKYIKKAVGIVTFVSIFFICFNNIVYANGAYTFKKLVYDNTALHAHTVWTDINNIENYVEGETQVIVVGNFSNSKAAYKGPMTDRYMGVMTGATFSAISYPRSVNNYFYAILGNDMNIKALRNEETEEISKYQDMPVYPSNGYCKMVDGKVVVRLN